jgi:hypothetical protein
VGVAFETFVRNRLLMLQQRQIVAWWEKQEPSWFYDGRRKAWQRGAPSGADFHGVLSTGAAFAIEAKSTGPEDDKRCDLILEARVSEKQRKHLDAIAAIGGPAFLAVQFRPTNEPWTTAIIPWREVPWRRAVSRHHLEGEAAQPWRLPQGRDLFEHLILESGKVRPVGNPVAR